MVAFNSDSLYHILKNNVQIWSYSFRTLKLSWISNIPRKLLMKSRNQTRWAKLTQKSAMEMASIFGEKQSNTPVFVKIPKAVKNVILAEIFFCNFLKNPPKWQKFFKKTSLYLQKPSTPGVKYVWRHHYVRNTVIFSKYRANSKKWDVGALDNNQFFVLEKADWPILSNTMKKMFLFFT